MINNNDRNDYSISYYANIEIKNNKNNTMIIIIIIIIIIIAKKQRI